MPSFQDLLVERLRIECNLLMEEIMHIAYILKYFSFEKNSIPSNSLREVSNKISKSFLESISNKVEELLNAFNEFKKSKDTKENGSGEADSISKEFLLKFFELQEIKRFFLEHLEYLQKKIISMMEGFPDYYPRPKCSSTKEAIKLHVFMENLSEDFNKLLCSVIEKEKENFLFTKLKNREKKISVYRDFLPETQFLGSNLEVVTIKTDSFIPQRQSWWIILFHEVLHHLFQSNFQYLSNKFIDLFRSISNSINISLLKTGIEPLYFTYNLFIDIFIDWLLVKTFGLMYLLPFATALFGFDDKSFYKPYSNRVWYVRIKIVTQTYLPEKEPFLNKWEKQGKEIKKEILDFLEKFKRKQIEQGIVDYKLFLREEIIISLISKYLSSFAEKKMKNIIEKIQKEIKRSSHQDYRWICTYIKYLCSYYELKFNKDGEDLQKNYKEGRALCRAFCDLLCFNKINKYEDFKKFFDLPVYKFQYIKVRCDCNKKINEFTNLKSLRAWCFGPYSFLGIKEDIHEKVDRISDRDWIKVLKKLIEKNFNESEIKDRSDIEKELILSENFAFFYKEDLHLTLYNEESKEMFKSMIDNHMIDDCLLIFIKYQILNKNVKNFKHIKDAFENFKSKLSSWDINVFHFISFDWFDFCTLMTINLKNIITKINLCDFLKELKEKLLINKNNNFFYRTETDIFIGKNIINENKIKVCSPLIVDLRVTSHKLHEADEIIRKIVNKNLKNKILKIYPLFGIKDISIHFEVESFKNFFTGSLCEILSENDFSDFQIIPYIEWWTV